MKIVPILISFLLAITTGCGRKKEEPPIVIDMNKLEEPLININKKISRDEKVKIDAFVKRNNWEMTETGTGLRYMIFEPGKGIAPESEDVVLIDFDVKLLDGTLCYSSKETGAEYFTVDHDHVESGMHEAMKYMHEGDKAMIIIPSHLAFGLAGDEDKIPMHATVVYNIHVLKVLKTGKKKSTDEASNS